MKMKEIKKLRRKIKEIGIPAERSLFLTGLAKRLEDNIILIKEQIANCVRDYRLEKQKWHIDHSDSNELPAIDINAHSLAKRLKLAGWAAILIEIWLGSFLFVISLNLPWIISALFGICVAILLSFLFESALAHYMVDHDNPKTSNRRLKTWSLIFVATAAVCLVPVISCRALPWLGFLVPVSGGFSALFLPILSGLLFSRSHLVDWSYRFFTLYLKLSQELSDTESFLREVEARINEGASVTATRAPNVESKSVSVLESQNKWKE